MNLDRHATFAFRTLALDRPSRARSSRRLLARRFGGSAWSVATLVAWAAVLLLAASANANAIIDDDGDDQDLATPTTSASGESGSGTVTKARLTRASRYEALERDISELEKQSNVLKQVVKLTTPSVVHIEADKVNEGPTGNRRGSIEESGSGCIVQIADQTYVMTNRHVIKFAGLNDIRIRLSGGRVLNPTRVWSDPETDIALMAVNAKNLAPARLGNSDQVEIGDFVLAMGSPFGLSHSVTFGIISAKGRRDLDLGDDIHYQDFIQTDAAINPGNSGGPLINLRGELVGINTAIATNTGSYNGIGFTIPINMAMAVAKQLVDKGYVARAWLGVSLDRKFGSAAAESIGLKSPRGARVSGIQPKSPAESSTLRAGDVILEFNGVRVESDSHLPNLVSLTEIGATVPVVVFRDHKQVTLSVTVGERPSERAAIQNK